MLPWSRAHSILFTVLVTACHPVVETAPPKTRAPGSERMAQRLALLADAARPLENTFVNQERLALMRSFESPAEPSGRARAEFRLANEMLRAGRSAEAVERFNTLAETVRTPGSPLGPEFGRQIRSLLAAAHLRVGEQENCLERHTSDSCLLPIRASGVHRQQQGSRAAMAELAELLEEDPDDLLSRWLFNLAAMTVGDYPEKVPLAWRIPPEVFASDYDVGRFVDVAPHAGLDTVGLAGGSVVEDFDGDGYLDVMVSSWGLRDPLQFFVNRRDGTFDERTEAAGLSGLTSGLNLVHADYDNDGDADVLVLRGAWLGPSGRHPNSLLENRGTENGTVTFVDVTERVGLLSFHPTQTAAWGDYDNDGWLDLFIGNESLPGEPHPCQLYRNNGPGADGTVTFTDVAAEVGVAVGGYVKGVAWGDVDNDGRLDLYLSRLVQPNLLFYNRGSGFHEIASEAGVSEPIHSFPTWFFDYDNDGWLDLFVAGYPRSYTEANATQVAADYLGLPTTAATPRLYRNLGAGAGLSAPPGEGQPKIHFADVTTAAGLDHVLLAMGANFGDLDNDGYLDFYLGTGAPDFRALIPNRMFRNDGGRTFQDVTSAGGFGHLQKGHGVSFGDLDNDGDQDVFTVIGGAYSGDVYQNALFLNPGHGHRWITLRLEGTSSNRSAIGARLRLELDTDSGRQQIFATVSTGGSFGASSLQQEIGLGTARALPVVEVSWPSGRRQVFRDLPLDSTVALREGDPEPVIAPRDR
ncbi:MAG: CRTAC1 family protein [Acidobacteriota bacterium]